ncbi:MAG: peroxiredoxin [Pseudomonadota bacterium]
MSNLYTVDWSELPAPLDDGAAALLVETRLPSIALPATSGLHIDLSALSGWTVVYIYPMTGRPDRELPTGWDEVPGARGCTPQSCAFRDHYRELSAAGADHVFGLSTQDLNDQAEAVARLHLPYPLLSDHRLVFADAVRMPRFQVGGDTYLKRMTLIIFNGVVKHVFYPVFPPDENPVRVVGWLRQNSLPRACGK